MNYLLLVGFFAILITLNGTLAFSEELVLSATSTMSEYDVGVYPTISGKVTGSQGEPIPNVYVYALFPSKTVEAMTNSNGKFSLNPLTSYPVGEYSVDVYARSETVLSRVTVTFEIIEPVNQKTSEWLSDDSIKITNSTLSHGRVFSSNNNTFSQSDMVSHQFLLDNQIKNTTIVKIQNGTIDFVDEQRHFSKLNLEEDLLENSRDIQKGENRDAFASFVAKLDSLVHAIFWDQYDFTQKVSDDAYQAKLSALENGKTPQDAMKVYQDEAAVSRTELSEFMKELNIKHGFTNATAQEPFDENGKVPRNNHD